MDANMLEDVLGSATGRVDRHSLSPATASHGPAELLVLAAPEREPYPAETRAVDRFMDEGGTVLVFTANTAWNSVFGEHGISLHGNLLLPAGNHSGQRLLTLDLPDELGGGRLLAPNSTAITTGSEDVRTWTPEQSMVLDIDGDGQISRPPDGQDEAGEFPIVAVADVGEGRLVVVASAEAVLGPGLAVRNLDAASSMTSTLADGGTAAFSTGTHPRGYEDVVRGPASAALGTAHWSLPGGILLLLAGAAIVALLPARGGPDEDHTELDDYTTVTREVMMRGSA